MAKQIDVINAQHICFSYHSESSQVIRNLTLSIPAGRITAIIGPNGAGKTTLIKILGGLLMPTRGELALMGKNPKQIPRREMGRIFAYIPQYEHLPAEISVREYILLGRAPYINKWGIPRSLDYEKVDRVIGLIGIGHLSMKKINSISGGEWQRTRIARALAQEPHILLLDEPTTYLDMRNRRRMLTLLKKLIRSGITIVFTTHDPEAAMETADYVVMLKAGIMAAYGTPEEIMTSRQMSALFNTRLDVVQIPGKRFVVK